jgi:hypothetical protein
MDHKNAYVWIFVCEHGDGAKRSEYIRKVYRRQKLYTYTGRLNVKLQNF